MRFPRANVSTKYIRKEKTKYRIFNDIRSKTNFAKTIDELFEKTILISRRSNKNVTMIQGS